MFDRDSLHAALAAGVAALGMRLERAVLEKLLDYLALIEQGNAVHNLTAIRDPREMVTKHLLDSLAVAPYLEGDTLADIGSGAGLPGIPLALAQPARRVWLIESNGKKARFLKDTVSALGLPNVEVVHARAEGGAPAQRVDAAIARAVASLADLLRYAQPWLQPDGALYAMKGPGVDAEFAGIPRGHKVAAVHRLVVPGLDAERNLVVLRRAPTRVREAGAAKRKS